MSFFLVYLTQRFFYRIWMFLSHWYLDGFRFFWGRGVRALETLDRFWALKITLKNFFEPLYQDHTAIGHILGFIFRFFRVATAAALYFLIIALALILYVLWGLVPVLIINYGITS